MRVSAAVFALVLAATPAAPAVHAASSDDNVVDLQLVLAVDVSGSMDLTEQRIQRNGYVEAFHNAEVQQALTSGPYGRIAVTYVEWASSYYQTIVLPWRVIGSVSDAVAFANDLDHAPISREGRTSISGALLYAASAFDSSPVQSDRRTIDISGDGANNDGSPVAPVRDQLVKQGFVINGLPILINPSPIVGGITLDAYYHDCVIGGPGAFLLTITTPEEFATAIRQKLILEIASGAPHIQAAAQQVQLRAGVDCLAGETSRNLGFPP